MFGMGFMEILLIAIIAVIALGPEKLPNAMVQIAKFIRKIKSGLDDAKTTIDTELNISEMKQEANKYKAQLDDLKSSVANETKIDLGLNDYLKEDVKPNNDLKVEATYHENNQYEKLKENRENEEKISFKNSDESNKFKVQFNDEKKEDNA